MGELLRWRASLLADFWHRGRFVEAAVLAVGLEEPWPTGLPAPVVVRVAATRSVGPVGQDLWADAVLDEGVAQAARAALAAAAAAELAARGDSAAHEALSELRPAMTPAWGRVADAMANYWNQTGAPLPIAGLDLQAAMEAGWQGLRDALARATAKHFKFPSGAKTHHHLFDGGGAFAQLRRLVERTDAVAVADWLAREKVDRLGDYLDDATRAADPTLMLIGRPVRESYLTLLGAVVDAAHDLVTAAAAAGGPDARRQAERAREVARAVHREWDALAVEAAELQAPDTVLLDAVRDGWRHLSEWGAQ
jgi:hypothetical protein